MARKEKSLPPIEEEEIPYELPKGWKWVRLGDVCEIKRGTTITKKTKTDGKIPVIAGGQKPAYYNGLYNREGKTITIAGSGAYAGYISYWDEPIFVSDAFSVKTNEKLVNIVFIYYFLLGKQSYIYSLRSGSGIPHIYAKNIVPFLLPLPPIEEQKRIVDSLESHFNDINQAETYLTPIDNLSKRYQRALLRQAMRGELVAQNPQDKPAGDLLDEIKAERAKLIAEKKLKKEKPLPPIEEEEIPYDLPKGWKWVRLGDISHYSNKRINYKQVNEKNYIGVDNLLKDKKGKINSKYLPKSGTLTQYEKDDILIGNIRPYLKKIWLSDCLGGASGDIIVIHIIKKIINPSYLYQTLASDTFFSYNMKYAKGVNMPRGNRKEIIKYLIPLPPLEEQKRIVRALEERVALNDKMQEKSKKALDDLPRLKKSLLKRAFRGELTS